MNSVKNKTAASRRPATARPPAPAVKRPRTKRVRKISLGPLTVSLRKFRTNKARRSKRYKQLVITAPIFGLREVAVALRPKKKRQRKPFIIFPSSRLAAVKTAAAGFLLLAGLCGALVFGTHIQKPVSFGLTPSQSKVLAAPPPVIKTLPKSDPVRLRIPKIGIDTQLAQVGLLSNGHMEMPWDIGTAAWYKYSPTPGEKGPAVIVGHLDGANIINMAGIFYKIHELAPGDQISVIRADGTVANFKVLYLKQVPQDNFPTQEIYGNINYAGIRLITCGGTFDDATGHYNDNTVVFGALE